MAGWIRRNWIPTAGMAVAVAFVAWLAWINVRGSGSGSAAPTPSARVSGSPSASASASASADPAQAQVEAAAKDFIAAYYDSYRTADARGVEALVVPGSQADGNAGAGSTSVRTTHHTVLLSQLTYESVQVDVIGSDASANLSYTTVGTPAEWPSLATTGAPQTKHWTARLQLVLTSGRWLVDTFN